MTAIYLHYPYCETLCPYCDFFSSTKPQHEGFFDALWRDMDRWHEWLDEGPIRSLYLGGGTPSRMPLEDLARCLDELGQRWGWPAGGRRAAEITLEANPGDMDRELIAAWARLGISRVSLGTQSFRDEELRQLGRRHDAAEARRALDWLAQSALPSYSCDLIYGLPGQERAALQESLDVFAELRPPHLSLYGLTIEPGTTFGTELEAGRFEELPRRQWIEQYRLVCDWAVAQGYRQYEISNFAKPGQASQHNRHYWRNKSWVGLGPGAHGQRRVGRGIERRGQPRSVQAWMAELQGKPGAFLEGQGLRERLEPAAWLRERCMVGVRDLERGIEPRRWAAELGLVDEALFHALDRLVEERLLSPEPPHCLAAEARFVSDSVAERLLLG